MEGCKYSDTTQSLKVYKHKECLFMVKRYIRIDNSVKRTSMTDQGTNSQTGKQTKVLSC